LVTVYEDEPLVHTIEKFERYGFGRLPVLDRDNGRLAGILTKSDIIHGLLKKLEVAYEEEEIHRYRASHFFEDIIADKTTLSFEYHVPGNDFKRAGEAASSLKKTLNRLGIHPKILRRIAVATYEAEMNMVIYARGGELTASVETDQVRVEAADKGPGIPDIEKAFEPGFSTAPEWVRELGFGAGMGLPNIKKCADELEIDSKVGEGTRLGVVFYTEEKE
ncbi:MAG: CBS domain-containing protein, partial [Proteobacteria bacterium]|nr:CBS domain-containing protein [Pseudomonadota bacterium]